MPSEGDLAERRLQLLVVVTRISAASSSSVGAAVQLALELR